MTRPTLLHRRLPLGARLTREICRRAEWCSLPNCSALNTRMSRCGDRRQRLQRPRGFDLSRTTRARITVETDRRVDPSPRVEHEENRMLL
jgi:hypothetical protein